jgi:predicted alpha/beta superfamily hydrolase
MKGKWINSRDVAVWLPPGYDTEIRQRYPVLYMHDGQNVFDVKESSFGMEWKVNETAVSLIKQNRITPVIIVGIYNTRNRNAEYSYTDSGYAYMKFIVEELKPFIDKTYRTLPGRKNTAVMGSSMGGLISLMLVWEYPDIFSKAACLSPAFKTAGIDYLPYIEKYKGPKKDIDIYIDNGGVGLENELQPGIEETISLLESKGYKNNLDVFFDKTAEHNEKAWAARVWRPLLYMFGK